MSNVVTLLTASDVWDEERVAPPLDRVVLTHDERHLAAAIEAGRILILRDHVIKAMLERLGAAVEEIAMPFDPKSGVYAEQDHGHDNHGPPLGHSHHRHDDHGHPD